MAFEAAVAEYNDIGVASTNKKFRIDAASCTTMYGFKVPSVFRFPSRPDHD